MKQKSVIGICIVLILILFFLVSGCAHRESMPTVIGEDDAYTRAVLHENPDLAALRADELSAENVFYRISQGSQMACMEAELYPAAERWEALRFIPQGLATVVMAIDLDQTEKVPETWKQLLDADLPVGMQISGYHGDGISRAALAAIAYGIDGENYNAESGIRYLRTLYSRGNLKQDRLDCPVTICFDSEAMAMIRRGKNLRMVIPEDGTLSFIYGLAGTGSAEPVPEQSLLSAGLRLTDGRCAAPEYPGEEAYASAAVLQDFQRFHEVTQDFTRNFRRGVLHTHYLSSADGRENIEISAAVLLAIICWTGAALHRCPRRDMHRWVWLISGQTVAWITLSCFKYMLPLPTMTVRICWYLYYVFLLGLPLTSLYIADVSDRHPGKQKISRKLLPFYILYPILVVMVLTNDLHQMVFSFDLRGSWSSEYGYRPSYYLIFAYAITAFLTSLIMMALKSRKSPRRFAWVWPALIAVALITYNLGYIMGISIIRQTNMTITFCTLSILFMESVLHGGLIPTNVKYRKFFSYSPLNMQLLDRKGRTVLSTRASRLLNPEQQMQITDHPGQPLEADENTVFHSCAICGGYAVWEEDVSSVRSLQKKLQESIDRTRKANRLLQKTGQVLRKKISAEANARIFTDLEENMQQELEELSREARIFPDLPDRDKRLPHIAMRLCHIKRRCNLFFLSGEGNSLSGNECAVYMDEISDFAGYAGIRGLVRCGLSGQIPVSTMTLFYDFYYYLLTWAESSHAVLLGTVSESEEKWTFSLMSSESTENLCLPDAFLKALDSENARISRRGLEETEGIYLSILRKGGKQR